MFNINSLNLHYWPKSKMLPCAIWLQQYWQKQFQHLRTIPLRAMDAIHIGAAVILKADVFVSADKRQCEAAIHAGLRIEPFD